MRIGNLCQKTRQSKRISLHNVELQIQIKERILSQIEDGTLADSTMAPVYIKAFVKKYCEFLHIADAVPINELMMGEVKETAPAPNPTKNILKHGMKPRTQIAISLGAMLVIMLLYWVFSGAGQKTAMPIVLSVPAKLPLNENGQPLVDAPKQTATNGNSGNGDANQLILSLPVAGWVRIYDAQNTMVSDGVYEANTPIMALNPSGLWRILSDLEIIIAQYQQKTYQIAIPPDGTPLGKLLP